ncbi:protein-glutamate O-methyltransferase CheR [Marinobacter halodurans]|uniref:Protein-glutamate O-methyltransferase CheR n=1 Tax=Marinobacter halodurans TaxID=2528979 RepID=A0ABY1ZQP0_9GAMM|nr:protein-glutamate O-methyltransferase CheR [Marinobacter halodurans]TBW57649.1 protein-glutamate O-methyltransferase CheR [Marinobacter halodurans]
MRWGHEVMPVGVDPDLLAACQRTVRRRWGLDFPVKRWPDLERQLINLASALELGCPATFAARVAEGQLVEREWQALASALTVGETYFLRDQVFFEHLIRHALTPLIARRRAEGHKRLRIWSAGCSSGEETYSLAIFLRQLLPDMGDWSLRILGTDIDERALAKARAGRYGAWSFRQVEPAWRSRYFRAVDGKYWQIEDDIRQSVEFAHLNLSERGDFEREWATAECDLILCRYVLMYFQPDQALAALRRLKDYLAREGVLAVAAVESLPVDAAGLSAVPVPGALLLRAVDAPGTLAPPVHGVADRLDTAVSVAPAAPTAPPSSTGPSPVKEAVSRQSETARPALPVSESGGVAAMLQTARELADRHQLSAALKTLDDVVARDPTCLDAYWLLSAVRLEQGEREDARRQLGFVLYLAPDLALAHYQHGLVCQGLGRHDEGRRSLKNCLRLLADASPDEPVREGEGLTVGDLRTLVETALRGFDSEQ